MHTCEYAALFQLRPHKLEVFHHCFVIVTGVDVDEIQGIIWDVLAPVRRIFADDRHINSLFLEWPHSLHRLVHVLVLFILIPVCDIWISYNILKSQAIIINGNTQMMMD